MELIQNPEQKAMYDKCKYRVKLWEYHFRKQYGRVPSKLDIREAESEVRFAYKMYFNLKSAAIERSFVDIDGFQSDEEDGKSNEKESIAVNSCENEENINDKVWGTDLNNQAVDDVKVDKPKSNVNASFSQKLFGGSKFSKRNPRKSLSAQNKKSQNNTQSLSQQNETNLQDTIEKSLSQEFFDSFIEENSSNFKIVKQKPQAASQSLDVIQSMLRNDYKLKQSLDTGWINRITDKIDANGVLEQSTDGFDLSKKCVHSIERSKSLCYDYDSDDVIANSEDEACDNVSRHVSKKMKMDLSRSVSYPGTNMRNDEKLIVADSNCEDIKQVLTKPSVEVIDLQDRTSNTPISLPPIKDVETKAQNESNDKIEPIKDKSKTRTKKSTKTQPKKQAPSKKNPVTIRRSTRSKQPLNLKENSDSDDGNHSETELDDSSNNIVETTKLAKQNKSPKIRAKIKDPASNEIPEEVETYELEYSVKPRIITVPRITKLRKTAIKIANKDSEVISENKTKTKQDFAKEKLQDKIASGTLNENFVTINIKKKVFVRGKKGMNFSKYKKQMWKNKKKALSGPDMDMGGCDGGVLTCFGCGDVGHFARQCPKRHGDKLLPLDVAGNADEESPFPTLEEAEKMAEESALVVRKSNKKLTKKGNDQEDVSDDTKDYAETCEDEIVGDSQDNDSDDDLLLAETLKLEELVAKIDAQAYIDSTTFIKPYYELTADGNVIDTTKEVYDALKEFGFSQFRPGQETAIMRILSGKSTLVTLSTGSGKSLCYQLPAYIYSKREPCIALVISPLVSLMEDQVSGLPPFLKAACLHTNQTKTQREKVMELVSAGSLSILLVSPEAVAAGERSTGFGSLLRQLPPISFACIDEAHCVSQWSHNFRPSYLMICRILRERLGVTTILGLTATATVSTANNIIEHIQVEDGADGIISDVPLPDNLHLTVSRDGNRDNALLELLLSERFSQCRSVIVYCTRREECERVAAFLRTSLRDEKSVPPNGGNSKKRKRMSVQAEPYHAGLSASRRKSIQKSFMSGELRIVVATVAFGMGINKSDIRSVIHYNMPSSFESYVQEIGRAGRDGLPAHCHLFLDSQGNDEHELRRHIHANSIDRHVIRKLLQRIFIPCSCKATCPKHEVAFSVKDTVQALDVPEENIATLLCYLELHDHRFVQVLRPVYTTCKIISYKGGAEIRRAAKECAPLAMGLALYADKQADNKENIFEFPVVDVASAMGWDSGICKHKLKNLEWTSVNGQPKRSNLSVEFSNLGFCVLAPGNLDGTQLDDTLDYLYKRVVDQEKMCLMQLRALHTTLSSVAAKTYKGCLEEESKQSRITLKEKIREYFNSANPLTGYEIEEVKRVNEEYIVKDTRQLVTMYRDNVFTGRAVARIFHGIQSPNYPAVIWGRCKFWRSHLKDDFHEICNIATGEILKMRLMR